MISRRDDLYHITLRDGRTVIVTHANLTAFVDSCRCKLAEFSQLTSLERMRAFQAKPDLIEDFKWQRKFIQEYQDI